VTAQVVALEGQVAALQAAAAGRTPATAVEQVRAALEWAGPFMLATLYVVGVYSIVRGRAPSAH
jgi:hypothetical protein